MSFSRVDTRRRSRLVKSQNQPRVYVEQDLAGENRRSHMESDRAFLSMLERSEAGLSLQFVTPNTCRKTSFPGVVAIDSAIPKAGAFTIVNPFAVTRRAAGVSWPLEDMGGGGKSDRPCNFNSRSGGWVQLPGVISHDRIPATGHVAPTAGKTLIETVWDLAPFFPAGGPESRPQAFVFRMLESRCESNTARVDGSMSFTVDVSAMGDRARGLIATPNQIPGETPSPLC